MPPQICSSCFLEHPLSRRSSSSGGKRRRAKRTPMRICSILHDQCLLMQGACSVPSCSPPFLPVTSPSLVKAMPVEAGGRACADHRLRWLLRMSLQSCSGLTLSPLGYGHEQSHIRCPSTHPPIPIPTQWLTRPPLWTCQRCRLDSWHGGLCRREVPLWTGGGHHRWPTGKPAIAPSRMRPTEPPPCRCFWVPCSARSCSPSSSHWARHCGTSP